MVLPMEPPLRKLVSCALQASLEIHGGLFLAIKAAVLVPTPLVLVQALVTSVQLASMVLLCKPPQRQYVYHAVLAIFPMLGQILACCAKLAPTQQVLWQALVTFVQLASMVWPLAPQLKPPVNSVLLAPWLTLAVPLPVYHLIARLELSQVLVTACAPGVLQEPLQLALEQLHVSCVLVAVMLLHLRCSLLGKLPCGMA